MDNAEYEKKSIAIFGCGGVAKELAEIVTKQITEDVILLELPHNIVSRKINNIYVIQEDHFFEKEEFKKYSVISGMGEPALRSLVRKKILKFKLNEMSVISDSAIISNFAQIEIGSFVNHRAIISCNSRIGTSCYVNKCCIIGHDSQIGNFCVLGPNVFIGGGAIIGNNVFIGSGAIIREKVKIGDDCIIGMGSVVVKDVEKSQVVVGNPAKFIRYNDLKKVFN